MQKRDARLIQHWYEWPLWIGAWLALAIIVLMVIGSQIAAGWRW